MGRNEMIRIVTPLTVAQVEDALVGALPRGAVWTTPGLAGRVLAWPDGRRVNALESPVQSGCVVVFLRSDGDDAEHNRFSDDVFDAVAAALPDAAVEMLDDHDETTRTRPSKISAI